jgi:hypothetical protein
VSYSISAEGQTLDEWNVRLDGGPCAAGALGGGDGFEGNAGLDGVIALDGKD